MKTIDECVCCGSNNLSSNPAVFMPFVTDRIFGWKPTEITKDWGLRTLKEGTSYLPCLTLICNNCGLVFSDIRFNDREMSKLYYNYRGEEYTNVRELYEPGYKERNENLIDETHVQDVEAFILNETPQPKTILDFGGDAGEKTPFSKSSAVDIYDIGEKPLANRIEVIDKKYDLVVCAHVLEHVSYPFEVLAQIKQAMQHGSYLYIELPREQVVINNTEKRHWHEHINFFTRNSLYLLLKNWGFSIVKYEEKFLGDMNLYMILCRLD